MTDPNWNLLGQPIDVGARFQQGYDGARMARQQNALLAQHERQAQQQQETRDASTRAGKHVAAGDYAGAGQEAAQSGDMELMRTIRGLSQEQRQQIHARNQALTPLRLQARQMPYEQRRQFIATVAPRLQAELGMTAEELAAYDPTDAQLDADITLGMTVEQQLARDSVEWQNVQGVGSFATDAQGRPLASGDPRLAPAAGGAAPQGAQAPANIPQGSPLTAPTAQPTADASNIFQRMIGAESNGQQFGANGQPLTSPAGAIGIAQVMPATAPEAARLAGVPFDENRYRTDPQYNRALGEAYFQEQLRTFGDPAMAVAAYNAGPGRVRQAVQQGGENWQAHLPAETRGYLQTVMGSGAGGGGQDERAAPQPPAQSLQDQARTGVITAPRPTPPGYQYTPQGTLQAIAGGPGDQSYSRSRETRQDDRQRQQDISQAQQQFNSEQEVRQFRQVRIATDQIRSLAKSGSPTDDLAIIFSFMRALDPASTVREGEFATAQNTAGVPDRIRNWYNQTISGTRLNAQQRQQMARTAYSLYRERARSYNELAQAYHPRLRAMGVENPLTIAPLARALTNQSSERQAAPRRGRTSQGVRWRRVQ